MPYVINPFMYFVFQVEMCGPQSETAPGLGSCGSGGRASNRRVTVSTPSCPSQVEVPLSKILNPKLLLMVV